MHIADLNTGTAKLVEAAETLQEVWTEVKTYWHDENSRNLEENHLEPIYPHVKLAIDAANRLSDILARTERECNE